MKEIEPVPLTDEEISELSALQFHSKHLNEGGVKRFQFLYQKYIRFMSHEESGIEKRLAKLTQEMVQDITCAWAWPMIQGLNDIGDIKNEIKAIFYSDQIEVDRKTGHCTCEADDPCPLYKSGLSARCSEGELRSAQIKPRYIND